MTRFIWGLVCLVVAACSVHAVDNALTDELVQSYAEAFERYQVNFHKHYATQEEYNKRLHAYAKSMEEVKELNRMHAGEGVTFGETSRSDLLEEEKGTFAVPVSVESMRGKRATTHWDVNTLPQPQKAIDLGHTANNVCCIMLIHILFFSACMHIIKFCHVCFAFNVTDSQFV